MKKNLAFFFLFFITFLSKAQNIQLSPKAEISVITCGPGHNELYATFGHSAFRIRDIPNRIDRVYNYGTFDFNTPNFYLKFTQGKLLYHLSAYDFSDFLQTYHREKRWVKGQVLDLTTEDVQQLFNFLENNAKPENSAYHYDFFYDNCSTKLYDVLKAVLQEKIIFNNNFDNSNYTHRDLIQFYLNDLPWSDFGIDLALGAIIDEKASAKEYMFLPDYVFKAFTKIEIDENNKVIPIVRRTENILLEQEYQIEKSFLSPFLFFSILSILIILVTYFDFKNKIKNKILDFTIFFTTGFIGIIILLLWFATNHTMTVDNLNILWAFAPNLIFAFIASKKMTKNYYYVAILCILLLLMLLLWIFKVQAFHFSLLPFVIALIIRYTYLWYYYKESV